MLAVYAKFLKPYRTKVIFVFLLTMLSSVTNLLLPMLSKRIIDEGVLSGENVSYSGTVVVMVCVAVVSMLIPILNGKFISEAAMGFSRDLRRAFFTHVLRLSQGDQERFGTASLISRQSTDILQMQGGLVQILSAVIVAPLMCIGGIIIAVRTSLSLSWIVVLVVALGAAYLTFIVLKVQKLAYVIQEHVDGVNQKVRETLNGMRVIRAFNKEKGEEDRFSQESGGLRDVSLNLNRYFLTFTPVMNFIVGFANLLILWFGSHYMTDHLATYGDIQAFIQYLAMIVAGMMMMSIGLILLPRIQACGVRISEVLNCVPSVRDPEKPAAMPDHIRTLEFQGVSCRYGEGGNDALSNVSFTVSAGQTLAIIGGTGAGKSTLLNLIPRYYDPSAGTVLVNGCDIRSLPQDELRGHIGIVPQKAFLFGDSILGNLRRGKADATVEEANHALDVAQAREFVEEKEYGLYTYIAPGGTNVSGGQRQRLSIARALIRRPDIYLFDDSFSALDFKTDAVLRQALKKETGNAIVIIVAQRISTIKDADQILVLDNGKVVGQGTHRELLAGNKVYREIALSQLSEEEMGA